MYRGEKSVVPWATWAFLKSMMECSLALTLLISLFWTLQLGYVNFSWNFLMRVFDTLWKVLVQMPALELISRSKFHT